MQWVMAVHTILPVTLQFSFGFAPSKDMWDCNLTGRGYFHSDLHRLHWVCLTHTLLNDFSYITWYTKNIRKIYHRSLLKFIKRNGEQSAVLMSLLEDFLYSPIITFYAFLSVKFAYRINHCLSNYRTVTEQLEAFLGGRILTLDGVSNVQMPRDPQNDIT